MVLTVVSRRADPLAKTPTLSDHLSSLPLLHPGWTPRDPLPEAYRPVIAEALALAERECRPADARGWAVAVSKLLEWINLFGLVTLPPEPDRRAEVLSRLMESYRAVLEPLPEDLALLAVQRIQARHKFRNPPLPAAVRECVSDEIGARRLTLLRLQTAARLAKFTPPPVRPVRPVANPESE